MMIVITIFSVLVSSTLSAVLKDGQLAGSALKLTQQNKGGNFAYAIQEHRLGGKSQSTSSFAEQVEKQKTSNLSSIEPAQLRFCFQAIHLIQQAGAAIQKVADLTRDEALQVLVNELEGATQKAFIYSEFSIGYTGEPLREAINATREATLAAHRVANNAYGIATKYASNPENVHIQEAVNSAQVAVQDAQRAVLAAQSAEQVLSAASIPAIFQIPETGLQSEYVYFEAPRNIPGIYKQAYSPSKLKIINIQDIPLIASSLEKTSKLRENFSLAGMLDRERYIQMAKPSTYNERLVSYIEELRRNSQEKLENLQETKKEDVMGNLFRQANHSQMMEEAQDSENIPEAWSYYPDSKEGMNNDESGQVKLLEIFGGNILGPRNQVKQFEGITPGNMNVEFDGNKELEFVNRGDINSDVSVDAGFEDTMGRIPSGKDVPEAEGYNTDDGLKVKSLESILKLIGGGKNYSAWVKKAEAAPVRVEATDYRTNFSEEMCSLWPENLQWSAKAVRASLLVAQDMGDVKTFAKSKFLGLHVENITESAKEASFHIVLAIDLRGAPVARAVRSAQKAVGAAVAGSEAALRAATEYAISPGARFAQLVLKAAQRADDAAQIAKDIIRNINLND